MDNDPFASIILPPLTSSQEQEIERCAFAHDDFLEQRNAEQSTGIVAVPLPGILNDDSTPNDDEAFQTASENSQSQHGSLQEHGTVIPTSCDESNKKRRIVIDLDVEMEIEDKDSTGLNVLPVRVPTEIVCENVRKNTGASHEFPSSFNTKEKSAGEPENGNTCQLPYDWLQKNFQPTSSQEEEISTCGFACDLFQEQQNEVVFSLPGCSDHPKEGEEIPPHPTNSPEIEVDRSDEPNLTETRMEVEEETQNHESTDRVLNEITKVIAKNVKIRSKDGSTSSSSKNTILNDIFNLFQRLVTEVDEGDTDFLKAAKERGMIFPRPRWWPPEGFNDDD